MAELPAVIPHKHRYSFPYLLAGALVGLVLGVLITWAFFTGARKPTTTTEIPNIELGNATSSQNGSVSTSSLSVQDQAAGTTVVIARAEVRESQWVVIHEEREGGLGNVLGAARFAGGASAGTVELLRGTLPGATYYAVIYADNGDEQFSLADDTPLRDASGSVKSVSFKAN